MKWMTTLALLAASVATAVVGICEFTQVRSLQYRVWSLERRRDQIERRIQRVGAAARARRTPRSILAAPGRLPGNVVPLGPAQLRGASAPDGHVPIHRADGPLGLRPAWLAPEGTR